MLFVLNIVPGLEKNSIAPIYSIDNHVFAEPSSERGVTISFGSFIDNRKNVNPANVAMVLGLTTLIIFFFQDIPVLYVSITTPTVHIMMVDTIWNILA
jgi:hypothetical protein